MIDRRPPDGGFRIEADVAVIGAGAAGLYVALSAARLGARVALISATSLAETASYWAQGGLAAALAAEDSPDAAPRRHAPRRAAARPSLGRPRPLRRGARPGSQARGARRPLRRRPRRPAGARPRGRPLDPAGRPRRRERDRPPDDATALGPRGRARRDRGDRERPGQQPRRDRRTLRWRRLRGRPPDRRPRGRDLHRRGRRPLGSDDQPAGRPRHRSAARPPCRRRSSPTSSSSSSTRPP